MHELGVVFHIIESVESIAADNDATSVGSVTLEIGEVSGVVESYLSNCWKWAVERSDVMQGCTLVIETIPAVTLCETCGKTYPTVEHGKICPHCKSDATYLVQGNEFIIKQIEVR